MCNQPELSLPEARASWADRFGVWASALCVFHCLLTPVLISLSTVAAHFLPSDERMHRSLAMIVALLGAIALLRGYRAHRRGSIILLMTAGLGCIFAGAYFGDRLPGHWAEIGITMAGSLLMISGHRLNHTFCRD